MACDWPAGSGETHGPLVAYLGFLQAEMGMDDVGTQEWLA